jgi:hypothetical protein
LNNELRSDAESRLAAKASPTAAPLMAAAAELVVGQIHCHERGRSKIPHTLLLDDTWWEWRAAGIIVSQ